MKVDIILDVEDDLLADFLGFIRDRAIISRTKGVASVELKIYSPSKEDLEELIHSKIFDILLVTFPDFELEIELKDKVTDVSVGSISLRQLLEAVAFDVNEAYSLLKYIQIIGRKVKFHTETAKRAIIYFLTNPCKFYDIIGKKLETHFVKLFEIATNMAKTGAIPLNQLWQLAYLVANKNIAKRKKHVFDFYNELMEYLSRIDEVDSAASWLLALKVNDETHEFVSNIDFEQVMTKVKKKGALLLHLASSITFSLLYGNRYHALEILNQANENLEKLVRDALTLLDEKVLCSMYMSGLMGAITPFMGCDILKELFQDDTSVSNYDYWGCYSIGGYEPDLMLALGGTSYVLFRRIIKQRKIEKIVRYADNYLDWHLVKLVLESFKNKYEKVRDFLRDALLEARTAIVNIPTRIEIEKAVSFLERVSQRLLGEKEARDELIKIMNDMTKEKEGAETVAKFILKEEGKYLDSYDINPKLVQLSSNIHLLSDEAKYSIIKTIIETDELRTSWEFYASKTLYDIADSLNDQELLTECVDNMYVQKKILPTIEDIVEYIKIKKRPVSILPESAKINVIMNLVSDKLENIVRIMGSEPISIMFNLNKSMLEKKTSIFIGENIERFLDYMDKVLGKLLELSKNLEEDKKLVILSKGRPSKYKDILFGITTPTKIIVCEKEECEEYLIDQKGKYQIYAEIDDFPEAVKELKLCIDRIKIHLNV